MLSKIVLGLAVTISVVPAASAASRHAIAHHHSEVSRHRAGSAYASYGFAGSNTVRVGPGVAPWDSPAPYDPYNHDQVKCIGGSCAPEWGI